MAACRPGPAGSVFAFLAERRTELFPRHRLSIRAARFILNEHGLNRPSGNGPRPPILRTRTDPMSRWRSRDGVRSTRHLDSKRSCQTLGATLATAALCILVLTKADSHRLAGAFRQRDDPFPRLAVRPPGEGPSLAREFVAARPEKSGAPNRAPSGIDRTTRPRIGQGSQYLYLSYGDNHGRNGV